MSNAAPSGGLLPHHLSESTFRFYEPYLTLAVRNFPTETSWDIATLRATDPSIKIGPNTFVARFRDAIVSLKRFAWPTTVDSWKLFSLDMAGKYSISLQPGTSIVWFKHRGHKGKMPTFIAEAREHARVEGASPGPVLWKDPTEGELEALCIFLNTARLSGIFLLEREFAPDLIERLLAAYNVSITWDGERKVTVVT